MHKNSRNGTFDVKIGLRGVIKLSLAEDSIDLAAFEQRKDEPSPAFEDVLKKLRKDGKI
jgi:hypothetical protein